MDVAPADGSGSIHISQEDDETVMAEELRTSSNRTEEPLEDVVLVCICASPMLNESWRWQLCLYWRRQ